MTIPNAPDAEPVIPPNKADATDKLISGLPGIFKISSEIKLKPGARVMTTPKATADDVRNTGMMEPLAPSLITAFWLGMYLLKTMADAMTEAAKPITIILATSKTLPAIMIPIKMTIGRILMKKG